MALRGSARIPVLAAMSALALTLAGPETASAQTAGGSNHVPAIAKLPNSAIAQFLANPQGLLATYASGGLALSARARSLVLTDPSLVNVLIEVAKNGNDAQQAAIGAGMAEAARILAVVDPQLAAQIQLAIAQSGSQSLIAAFVAASNATQTASTVGVSTNFSASLNPSTGASGASNGGPSGGFPASAFGSSGSGGGLTFSTSQSTSPSKSSL
ncbi:MAG: hypothetical protein ACLPSW_21905 [Roseiarcus sp.]